MSPSWGSADERRHDTTTFASNTRDSWTMLIPYQNGLGVPNVRCPFNEYAPGITNMRVGNVDKYIPYDEVAILPSYKVSMHFAE